jgi:putative nucleotidyltransferase with HDIG domain
VPTDPDRLKRYLVTDAPDKEWVSDKLVYLLSGKAVIPPFSAAAIKLGQLSRDENCQMADVSAVIQMDPGLASDVIRVASTVGFAARRISSIDQALMLVGMEEIRRIAFAMGVMKNFEHLKSQVDWGMFWLHSLLVARLTERVAAAYRPPGGSEYLAGLLHDCGKLLLEHYFPEDFDRIIIRATERACGHVLVEQEFLGVTHAQIGAAICECLQAHLEVIRGVWYHHDPFNKTLEGQPDNSKFLAACVSVADALANYKQLNIFGARIMDYEQPFDQLPEWQFLGQYQMSYGLELDLELELEKAREDLKSFGM